MRAGRHEEAWELSDAFLARRRATGFTSASDRHLPPHLRTVWDGRPIDGRPVLVRCHHGLGDTIQFVRLLPLLARRAGRVAIAMQAELVALLRGSIARGVEIVPADAPARGAAEVELLELPHLLRLGMSEVPRAVPYIAVDRRPRRAGCVGIVWRGGDWDARRSIPTEALGVLDRVPAVRYVNLQLPGTAQAQPAPAFIGPPRAGPSLVATAELVASLPLVVTIDTMLAHLAGALGIATFLLVHTDADWRWLEGRPDTPWYPTMRIFRQRRPGDWEEPLEEVARAIPSALAGEPNGGLRVVPPVESSVGAGMGGGG